MINGIEKLTEQQKELMLRVNDMHAKCVGNDYKDGMQIIKVWVDENNCVCVRLKNDNWYHYNRSGEWY